MAPIPPSHGFRKSHAVVVGISEYGAGFSRLRNASHDAEAVAARLGLQGYEVHRLVDREATSAGLLALLEALPPSVEPVDRVVFYFAGHGVAMNGDEGPEGFLIPADAQLQRIESYFKMRDLNRSLSALRCRHLLVILDCCFAGSFSWSGSRNASTFAGPVFREQYDRFVRDPACRCSPRPPAIRRRSISPSIGAAPASTPRSRPRSCTRSTEPSRSPRTI
jgi:hypothetical protein